MASHLELSPLVSRRYFILSASSLHLVLGGGCMRFNRKLGTAVESRVLDCRIGVRLGAFRVLFHTRHALAVTKLRVDGADADVGEETRE